MPVPDTVSPMAGRTTWGDSAARSAARKAPARRSSGTSSRRAPARRPPRKGPDLLDHAIDGTGRTLARLGRATGRAAVRVRDLDPAHRARVGIVIRTRDVAGYVRRLTDLAGVTEIETVTGEYDLIVLVAASSADELDHVLDRVSGWPETVRTTTWVVLKRYA